MRKVGGLFISHTIRDSKKAILPVPLAFHYAMPVRNALYDALKYAGQVTKTAQKHRAEKDWKSRTNDEFLSRFYREDRLIPVATLVIYFRPTPWDGPRTLYEMFGERPSEVMKYVSDYRMHLIEPAALSEDEMSRFHCVQSSR